MSRRFALTYEQIIGFIRRIAEAERLTELYEVTIIRLMNAINTQDYPLFYSDLEENKELLGKLLEEMDDVSGDFTDRNNYTNFIGALCWMFQNAPEDLPKQLGELPVEELQKRVFNLNNLTYKPPSKSSSWLQQKDLNYTGRYHYRGKYNEKTGKVVVQLQEENSPSSGNIYGVSWDETDIAQLSPFTPVLITVDAEALPLVTTALGGVTSETQYHVVPAIFLAYYSDKARNEEIKNGIILSLDIISIVASSGTLLATKVHWIRRLWALAEVAAAAGNIAVNQTPLGNTPELKKYIDAYNAVVGVIGLYRGVKSVLEVGKTLPILDDGLENFERQYAAYRKYYTELSNASHFKDAPEAFKTSLKKEAELVEDLRNELLKSSERKYYYIESPTIPRDGNVAKSLADYLAEQLPKVNRKTIEQLPRESQEWLQGSLNSSVHGKAFRNTIQKDEDIYDVLTLKKDKGNIHDLVKEHSIDEDGIKGKGKYDALAGSSNFKEPYRVGRELEKNVVRAIRDKSSELFKRLKEELGIDDLELYDVETQVHMYVNKQKQQYMVADLILYKTDGDMVTDMIIIEIKLNKNTPYTVRQETTFKRLVGEIAAAKDAPNDPDVLVDIFIRGKERKERFLILEDKVSLKQVKLLRISGDGTTSIDNVKIDEITQIND